VTQELNLPVTLLTPTARLAASLMKVATHARHIQPYIGPCQLPEPVLVPGKRPITNRLVRLGMRRRAIALTRSFEELVQRHVTADPAFGEALLCEGIDTMLAGDVDTGKAILCNYIKATIGFDQLGTPLVISRGLLAFAEKYVFHQSRGCEN
jgi:hypothetical protein